MTERFSNVLGQAAALAVLMHADGREAFEQLSAPCQAELRRAFDRLNAELEQLTAAEVRHD